jgi:hypothetical protein
MSLLSLYIVLNLNIHVLHQCQENYQRNEQIPGVDPEDSEVYSPHYSSHRQERVMGDAEGAGYETNMG